MDILIAAILDDDRSRVKHLLGENGSLVSTLVEEARLYESPVFHWIYVGDTALHLASAGYRVEIVKLLLSAGADPNSTRNHRRSSPLHYAADGYINGPSWNAELQVKTIRCLLDAGADINIQDKNGATPLHRAVRTRCAAAVRCLLEAGCKSTLRNKPGSTAFHLAVQDTGRGGSGAKEARAAQREIIETFLSLGVSTALKDGKGHSVEDCDRSGWIQKIRSEQPQ